METYKSEEVVEMLTAKIYPTDKRIPECRVIIRLTSRHLFISEDNYDGTFEDHYVIDFPQISEIKLDTPYKTSIDYSTKSLDKREQKTSSVEPLWSEGLLGGMFTFGKKGQGALHRDKESTRRQFLEIIYKEDYERNEHLYFDECNKSPEKLIKAFKKLKAGY